MAYGNNYYNGYNQTNGSNSQRQGSYQQRNNGNFNQQNKPQQTPEEFINARLDVYQVFKEQIQARGLDPADFAFGLTAWVTSYMIGK